METVTAPDGTRIAYARTGSGPPLVLVHGTTADHSRWEPVRPQLDEHFTVYAIDRRGRGESGDADDYSLSREADDVVAVVESIDAPAVVTGHSFGALCVLESTLRTDAPAAVVLYEPAIPVGDHEIYDPAIVEEMEALLAAGENEALLERFFRGIADFSDAELDALRSAPNWPDRVAAAGTALRETRVEEGYTFDASRFGGMTRPTLLLSGSESPRFLRDATAAVHDALPNSRHVVLEGQGHVAQNTAPDRFVEEIRSFCREIGVL